MKSLFEPNVNLLGKVMDMQLQRQNVLMGNIANATTPKYKPRELYFEEELQKSLNLGATTTMTRTSAGHIPTTFNADTFTSTFNKKFTPREVHGEDRVNIDKEMMKVSKNNLQYTTLSQVTAKAFEGIKNIIMEGAK